MDIFDAFGALKKVISLVSAALPSVDGTVNLDLHTYSLAITRIEHTAWSKQTWSYQYREAPIIGEAPSPFSQVVTTGTVGSSVPNYTSSNTDSFNPGGIGRQNRICDFSTVLPNGQIDPLKFSLTEAFSCRLSATIPTPSYYLSYVGGYASVMVSFKEGAPATTCTGPGNNPLLHDQDDIGPLSLKPAVPPPFGYLPSSASMIVYPGRTSWEHIWWDTSKPIHGSATVRLLQYGTPLP